MKRLAWLVALATLFLLSCSHELKAKKQPTVNNADLTYCNADQPFVVTGTGLSPMIVEGATSKPDLLMPKVCLTKLATNGHHVETYYGARYSPTPRFHRTSTSRSSPLTAETFPWPSS